MFNQKINFPIVNLNVQVISGVFSVCFISILFFIDFIIVEEVPFDLKIVNFFVILGLLSICYLGYAYSFTLVSSERSKKSKFFIALKNNLLSLVILGILMFSGFYLIDIYYDWQDRILSFIMTYLWFSLIRFTATTYSHNKKTGHSIIVLIALSFVYYFWTEIVVGHEVEIQDLEIYYLFFDYLSLVIASIIGLKLFLKLLVYLEQKQIVNYTKYLLSNLVVILYVVLIYQPYLYFIHQTSLFRYKNFWFYELPLILVILVILDLAYHYYKPFKFELLNKENYKNNDETTYSDKLIINQRKKNVEIQINEIAFITLQNSITLAFTFSNEKYILDKSLNILENELDPMLFFRVNRQLILSLKGTIDYKNDVNQKLRVYFHPIEGMENNTIISRYKAPKFKKWFRED